MVSKATPTLPRRPARPVAGRESSTGGQRRLSWLLVGTGCGALLVLLVALLLAGGRPQPAVPGLPDAGAGTGWAVPVVRLAFDLAAVTTVGALLAGVALLRPANVLPAVSIRAVRAAGWSAAFWSVTALLLLILKASESLGVPVGGLSGADLVGHAGTASGRAA